MRQREKMNTLKQVGFTVAIRSGDQIQAGGGPYFEAVQIAKMMQRQTVDMHRFKGRSTQRIWAPASHGRPIAGASIGSGCILAKSMLPFFERVIPPPDRHVKLGVGLK